MPNAAPLPDWKGEDVYLIGGGPSLRSFDWSQLEGLNTIGCNQAFQLGPSACRVCVFGDPTFWDTHRLKLWKFKGWVATNETVTHPAPWLHVYPRQVEGLSTSAVGWNDNTGAAAVNLALILGAKRVLLLGYDCRSDPSGTHWHGKSLETQTMAHYDKFTVGLFRVAQDLPDVFPGRRVLTVSDGASQLKCFPTVSHRSVGLRPPGITGA